MLLENKMIDYTDIESQANNCIQWIKTYFNNLNKKKAIIGISGGKDSTVTAMLCVKALGKENVIGILMPNGKQKDIKDSLKVVESLGIEHYTINIEVPFKSIMEEIAQKVGNASEDTKINTPARLRMTTLYALSPMFDALVANTCNLSEDYAPGGYATLFGDNAGSFAPLQDLTTDEVIAIGDYLSAELNIPTELIHKTPIDGLQVLTDEQKISKQTGIVNWTYARFNKLLRGEKHDFTNEEVELLRKGANAGKFKRDIVQIPKFVVNKINIFNNVV